MINAIWGITHAPFQRDKRPLLSQQKNIVDIAQQGGFSVIIGELGVGKTVLRKHIEQLDKERESTVVSCSRTLHTFVKSFGNWLSHSNWKQAISI